MATSPPFSPLPARLFAVLALLSCGAFTRVLCLDFSFPTFYKDNETQLILENSKIDLGAIQVTPDLSDPTRVMNMSGRSLHKQELRIWRKGENDGRRIFASFNSTFTLNISPYPGGNVPIGEGLAFIMTAETALPSHSSGPWLGIVSENASLALPREGIVAVEFDTRKSFPHDIDGNHVGLNLNSVESVEQAPLTRYGMNISGESDIIVRIQYDGTNISVFASLSNETERLVLSRPLDVSALLPEKVYVGFSASTGDNTFERNCVKSWSFRSSDIDEDRSLLWPWIAVPAAVIALLGAAFLVYWKRPCCREDLEEVYPRIEEEIQGSSMAPKKFKLRELRTATGNFSPKNKLGKGGFGTVYKGNIGSKIVAVKRVSKNSRQGKQEFVSEVTTIGSLSHKNLVKLIGWCYESNELLIVYEFMPNGSLEKYLFGDETTPELSWERRHNVIFGVAEALDYLHNGSDRRVLHRDVKASNIMLDSKFDAKLGDFGLARAVQRSEKTHHSTREIAGTPGYMAPESFFTGRATVETDVYAFGVLVLEVVSGRKPGGQGDDSTFNNGLVHWIWRLYNANRMLDAVDQRLYGQFDDDEMACIVALGLACCHPNPSERPSMRTILKVLIGEEDPPVLPEEIPAFVWPSMPPSFKSEGDTTLQGSQLTPFTEITGR